MGVGGLNTKTMLSMFLSLFDFLSVSFSFSVTIVIHLWWMTVVAHLRSPAGKSHLIRFLPRCHLFHPLIFYRNQSPLPAVPSVLHSGLQILAPSVPGILPDPLPSHSSLFPPFADAPPRPHRPHRPMGPAKNNSCLTSQLPTNYRTLFIAPLYPIGLSPERGRSPLSSLYNVWQFSRKPSGCSPA